MRLSFEVEGVQEAIRELDLRGKKAKNLSRPLKQSSDYIMERIKQNFEGAGSLYGKWPRRKKAYPWRMLQKSGAMRDGFRSRVSSTQAEISNTQPYFKYHQSRAPRKYLPRRVMMAIQEQEAREVTRIFHRHIMD